MTFSSCFHRNFQAPLKRLANRLEKLSGSGSRSREVAERKRAEVASGSERADGWSLASLAPLAGSRDPGEGGEGEGWGETVKGWGDSKEMGRERQRDAKTDKGIAEGNKHLAKSPDWEEKQWGLSWVLRA